MNKHGSTGIPVAENDKTLAQRIAEMTQASGENITEADEQITSGVESLREGAREVAADETGRAAGLGIIEGLSPIGMRGNDFTKAVAEESPTAFGLGKAGGLIGSAVTGMGLPGIGAKAGVRLGAKIAGTAAEAGKWTQRAARLGGLTAGAAVDSATIGVHEATIASQNEGLLGVPGAGAKIAENVGYDAALGLGLSVFGGAFPAAAGWVFKKRFGDLFDAAEKAKGVRLKANQAFNAVEERTQNLLDTADLFTLSKRMEQNAALGQVDELSSMIGTSGAPRVRGMTKGMKPTREPLTTGVQTGPGQFADPEYVLARRAMEKADDQMRNLTTKSLKDVAKGGKAAIDTAMESAVLAATPRASQRGGRHLLIGMLHAVDGMLWSHVDKIKPFRKLATRSLKAGRVTMDNTVLQGGKYVTKTSDAVHAFRQGRRSLKYPIITSVSDDNYRQMAQEFEDSDPAELEQGLRFAIASQGIPQEFANPIVEQMGAVHGYLNKHLPTKAKGGWLGTEDMPVNEEAKLRWLRRARAAMDPMSVMQDFQEGLLTAEAADALWETNPMLANLVGKQVELTTQYLKAMGGKFNPQMKRQISLLVNRGQDMGRTYDPKLVNLLQGNFTQEQANKPQPQGAGQPTNISGIADGHQTGLQGATQRLGF